MAEADVVDILEVFPSPVEGGELAVGAVFLGDVVAGVVALKSEVELGMECLAYLYGHVDVVLPDVRVGFVTRHKYLYAGLLLFFHSLFEMIECLDDDWRHVVVFVFGEATAE